MRRSVWILSLAILVFASAVVRADDFWTKKDWSKWSAADCKKMLTESPWAHTFGMVFENNSAALRSSNPGVNRAGNDNMEQSTVTLNYYVTLRSAEPVREAYVRNLQFAQKYDHMTGDQKKQFDEQTKTFLSRDFKDYILIHVDYETNVPNIGRDLANLWQSYPEDRVPVNTYLDPEHGDHVPPIRFVASKGGNYEFEFYFPRTVNGEPIIKPGDKEIALEFPHPSVTDFPAQRVYVVFKLDKMDENGKLIY